MNESAPVGHHHASQTECEQNGYGASNDQQNDLFELYLLAIHSQNGFQKMHRSPLDDPKTASVEDMNKKRDQKGCSPQGQSKVEEIHQRDGRTPLFRIAK